jgi:hypothetical protein
MDWTRKCTEVNEYNEGVGGVWAMKAWTVGGLWK